jgi:hypothetical protein
MNLLDIFGKLYNPFKYGNKMDCDAGRLHSEAAGGRRGGRSRAAGDLLEDSIDL